MPFTEDDYRTAVRSCRFCPMCHHADLVTTLTRRETTSPRGRGLTLFALEQGKLSWDASVADVLYRFTADGLSRHVCAGHINHDEMVIEGRRRVAAAGAAPEAVGRVRANIEKTGNPWGEADPGPERALGIKARRRDAAVLVVLGPAARVRRPEAARAFGRLLERAGLVPAVLDEEGDPGLLLYQLGLPEPAHASARTLAEKIRASGAREVVTPDPDVYRTLTAGFGDFPGLGKAAAVRHAAEFLETLAREGRLKFRPPAAKTAYHDPCALARFSPLIAPPRALIKAVSGRDPLELPWNREAAACSGECGGLPFTYPDLARAAAERRAAQARETGAEVLVTAGPGTAHHLAQAGGGFAKDLTEWTAECLVG